MDTARGDWHDGILAACGIDRSRLPRLVESAEISGTLAARPGNALASAGRHAGGGGRRRQHVRGRRRGRGAGWCGLHQPGNVGRLLRRQRSLRAGTWRRHAHPSPRRAGTLRPACRRVERRCRAGVDRRLARQARHRRADRRGRSGQPAAGRHACLHALPCRRAHAARQSPADRHFLGPDPHDGAASPRASRSGRRRSGAGRRPRCAGSRRRQDRAYRLDRRRRAQRAVGAPGRGCDRPAALPCRRPALGSRHRRRPAGARGRRRTADRRGRKHLAGHRRRSAARRTALPKESPVPRRICHEASASPLPCGLPGGRRDRLPDRDRPRQHARLCLRSLHARRRLGQPARGQRRAVDAPGAAAAGRRRHAGQPGRGRLADRRRREVRAARRPGHRGGVAGAGPCRARRGQGPAARPALLVSLPRRQCR